MCKGFQVDYDETNNCNNRTYDLQFIYHTFFESWIGMFIVIEIPKNYNIIVHNKMLNWEYG